MSCCSAFLSTTPSSSSLSITGRPSRVHVNFTTSRTNPRRPVNLAMISSLRNEGNVVHEPSRIEEQPQQHLVGDKDGVVIVDHGSRRRESNLLLSNFQARTGYRIVEPAHMELAEPTIKEAFGKCVQKGATRIIVSPYFLSPGRHWQQDIPALAAEASKEHSNIEYIVTAPLGLHELMVDVMNDRIKHCLSRAAGNADECTVCAGTGRCHVYPESSAGA